MSKYNRDAHAWLRWIDYEGPFLSEETLGRVFPNGLAPVEAEDRAPLREAWSDWRRIVLHRDPAHSDEERRAVHHAWIRFVLTRALELTPEDGLVEGALLPECAHAVIAEHRARVSAELALLQKKGRANDHLPRLLVLIVPAGCALDRPNDKVFRDGWIESAENRALALLRASNARLALVTNGEEWTLVHAKTNTPSSFVRWTAEQWFDEWTTLDAFRTLLSSYRFFGVPDEQQLERLFEESAKNQQGVTEQLGRQVRRAVEELVAAVDFADRTTGRNLVHAQGERAVYEAAVSVMMRLVFLLAAEERGLLLATDPRYDRAYAIQTLREQLESAATEHGEEVLEHRYAAWSRLLATFRAVHAGVAHHDLRLPAFGGTLFDPDRFPFLEGRPPASSWRDPAFASAEPIAINDRTVLHLLDALQTLEVRTDNGRERRKLSFGALDVEQIGHVYEGLLDHTVVRAKGVVVSLEGKEGDEPEVSLSDIEARAKEGRPALCKWLSELTGRTVKSLVKSLDEEPSPEDLAKLERACGEDKKLVARVRPWLALVRRNLADLPVVFDDGSFYVTAGLERRATGTHYTPRTLTEDIVRHALEPLVYVGPSEGLSPERWTLRSPAEILALRVCDPAMGSGAFLVQACRYLSARLVEAWLLEAERTGTILRVSPSGAPSTGDPREQLLPETEEERLLLARRFVVERCLYGVDKNPMAVEMARLSLWLVTLQKDRSFTFLDHALKVGDSLLGVTSQKQLVWFHPNPKSSDRLPDPVLQRVGPIQMALGMARELRETIEDTSTQSVGDLRNKSDLLRRSDTRAQGLRVAGDELVRVLLDNAGAKEKALQKALESALDRVNADVLAAQSGKWVERPKLSSDKGDRLPFHWAIEFPEVFGRENPGFDAIIANPPFMGGQKLTGAFGTDYRDYLVQCIADSRRGSADLVAYFFLRANTLVRKGGAFALISTNTIAQGDTREVGLDAIVAGGTTIYRAIPSMPWPGEANLEVSVVWCFNGGWSGPLELSGVRVSGITPQLNAAGGVDGTPFALKANEEKSYQGSNVLGLGFTLSPEEARALIEKSAKNAEVLQPYLNGEDLNSRPDQSASRWVINFRDWSLDEASSYEDCIAIVKAKVKPERDRCTFSKHAREEWWQYERVRTELYDAIQGLDRVLVLCLVTQHVCPAWASNDQVFAHRLAVFAVRGDSALSLLQSSMHEVWARNYSSTLETRLNYSPSDCFETFPFPPSLDSLDEIGTQYDEHRRALMLRLGLGLTKLYNHFHDPDDMKDEGIAKLRALHVAMDRAVCAAYGWSDLANEGALGHGFHETRQGVRYTVSEDVRRELLARLLLLNWARHAEEVARGLVSPDGKGKRSKSKASSTESKDKAPAREAIERAVWAAVKSAKGPVSSAAAAKQASTTVEVVEACMRYAARCGWVRGDSDGWSSNG